MDELPNYHLPKRPRLQFINEDVALALDRTKTSSRSATHILAAAATSVGHNISHLNLSHSTIHRSRINIRRKVAERLKQNLNVANHLTVHWDGRLVPESGKQKKVERVPGIVSGLDTEQLLGVPKFQEGLASNEVECK